MLEVKAQLIAFIQGVIALNSSDSNSRLEYTLRQSGPDVGMSITFGYGYHDPDKVLCEEASKYSEQLPVEAAVDKFLGLC